MKYRLLVFVAGLISLLLYITTYAQNDCGQPNCVYLPLANQAGAVATPTATLVPTSPPFPTSIPTFTRIPTNTPTPTQTPTPSLTPTPTDVICGNLSGVIESNLTLVPDCIYMVSSNVLVSENVTLAIPSGVTLKSENGVYIKVDGALIALGSEQNPVTFTGNSWYGIRITDKSEASSKIQHAIIEYGVGIVDSTNSFVLDIRDAQPELSHIVFRYNRWPLQLSAGNGYTATIDSSTFFSNTGQVRLMAGHNTISRSSFLENRLNSFLLALPGNTIISNTIEGRGGAPIELGCCGLGGTTYITHNIIRNSGIIFYSSPSAPVFILYNDMPDFQGISASTDLVGSSWCAMHVNFNNMSGYTKTPLLTMNRANCEVDLTNNWWGTTSASEIDSLIYDFNDDFELAKANYVPFALAPIPDAGAPPLSSNQ